jgi:hypothetical protein
MRPTALPLALAAAALFGCARPGPEYRTEDPTPPADLDGGPGGAWLNRIPPFAFEALRSPHARSAKFTLGPDGKITKYTVYVAREALPGWTHKAADEILGRGEDVVYEVEVYDDGSEVFEITRKVNGRLRELSVRSDARLMYVERQLEAKELPAAVASALRNVDGFLPERYAVKEGPGLTEYQAWGQKDGAPHRVRLARDGRLVAVQKSLRAEFELGLRE